MSYRRLSCATIRLFYPGRRQWLGLSNSLSTFAETGRSRTIYQRLRTCWIICAAELQPFDGADDRWALAGKHPGAAASRARRRLQRQVSLRQPGANAQRPGITPAGA